MNERGVGVAGGSPASPVQGPPPQVEVEEPNLMTNPDNQQAETKEWIKPLASGRDSRSSSGRKDTG